MLGKRTTVRESSEHRNKIEERPRVKEKGLRQLCQCIHEGGTEWGFMGPLLSAQTHCKMAPRFGHLETASDLCM